jgi:hypothetical protein
MWGYEKTSHDGGYIKIVIGRYKGVQQDVTYVRGAPTQIESYTFGDPFGPATASLRFPSITGFDDIDGRGGSGIGEWLADYAQVTLYWIPQKAGSSDIDPSTNQLTAQADEASRQELWRGFIVSIDVGTPNEGISVQCQGLLFQLDRYIQKPYFPGRPVAMERLIASAFSHVERPGLRFGAMPGIDFSRYPGWDLKAKGGKKSPFLIEGVPTGKPWTGYSSRNTGGWDRVLTGYLQDMLSVMYVPDEAKVHIGDQWTIMPENNVPILKLRTFNRPVDFTLWYGTPGVEIRLTRDTGPVANIIYGDGHGYDGVTWRNAQVSTDGMKTTYDPLASIKQVFPVPTNILHNDSYDKNYWVNEQLYKYGEGFDLDAAINSAEKSLVRDVDPGWNGSMTLSIDPSSALSRYQLQAGMTVLIKGLLGSGDSGVRFHIADVQVSPMQGTVEMKLDTRYRDLLNLEESQMRTRDPLTPAKMLQVNRRSVLIEDLLAPWDSSAGSGFIPKASTHYFKEMHNDAKQEVYPWKNWIKLKATDGSYDHRPKHNPKFFVKVKAAARHRDKRWTIVPVIMSQKGTCRLTQIAAYKADGTPARCRFHVSVYNLPHISVTAMPGDGSGHSPFIDNAFETIDPSTGLPWEATSGKAAKYAPDSSMIIGWGNKAQPAGYSPGRASDGNAATGLLYDESTWSWNFEDRIDLMRQSGAKQHENGIALSVAFYAEFTEDVYFIGRFFRQEPGGS